MINSHWVCKDHFPAAVFQFIWTFQTAKDLTRIVTKLAGFEHISPVYFTHPRTTVFRGLGRIKTQIDRNHPPHSHPILYPPCLSYHMCSHSHTSKFMMHVSIFWCVCAMHLHTDNSHRESPVESHIRSASLKRISHYNGVFKSRIIH